MPWLTALKHTARSGVQLERTVSDPLPALRAGLAVALVVFGTLLLSTPQLATSAAMGAFIAGTGSLQRSYRPRPVLALGAAAGLSVSTFVGYLASPWPPLFVLVLAVWAFGAGLAWGLSQVSGVVASTTVAVMLVVVTLPASVLGALHHAALIALGGVVQALLMVLWPVRRWSAQRDALADAYASLADYARRLRVDPFAGLDPDPLMAARSAAALTPHQARRRPPELGGMREPLERIRPVLAALADPRVGAAETGPERERTRELLAAAADLLDAVARSIRTGAPVDVPERIYRTFALPRSGPVLTGPGRQAAVRLIGLLSDTVDTLETASGEVAVPTHGPAEPRRPTVIALGPIAATTVRRHWDWSSPVLRHAVRLSAVSALGEAIGLMLPFRHGYWAPLTAVMVMRPDFSQTYARGVARILGTALGAGASTGVILLTGPGQWACATLAVLCICCAYLTTRTGYAALSAFVAGYVVFLLSMDGAPLAATARERIGETLLGGALALAAYAVFPTWQTVRLPDRLADYIQGNGGYAAAAVAAFGDPSARRRELREALLAARRSRSELVTASAQAEAEPVRHRGLRHSQLSGARSALAALGRTVLLMEAHLPAPDAPSAPGAARFAEVLRTETARAADAVRAEQSPDLGDVRAAYDAWLGTVPEPASDAAAEADATQLLLLDAGYLVEALEALQEALQGRQ
jgi:uncharacterized membrane protein YccC